MADATAAATVNVTATDVNDAQPVLRVQVCHALPEEAFLEMLVVPAGATLGEALPASGLRARYPALAAALDADQAKAGIFGKIKSLDTVLRDGDRIEIYRPLQADPKESRRRRAKHKEQLAGR